ncbi:hypothetical protein [Fodinicurvata halophila]|uniref:hypothetical protein n=1 Tax=Fodinicurvata halophila TaxID=1419723 RepID=UPI003629C9B1
MSKAKQLIFLLVAGLVAGVLWHLFSSLSMQERGEIASVEEQEDAAGEQPVIVREVSFESGASTLVSVGTGQAQQSITLFPESAGQVRDVLFSAGQEVVQGISCSRWTRRTRSYR